MSDWKYDLDEVGDDADSDPDPVEDPTEDDVESLEPGSPTFENALFVALGVVTTLFVFARVVLLASG